MDSDIEGTRRVAHLAREFGWTWDKDDVARFCSEAGWGFDGLLPAGGTIVTNLNVGRPVAFVQLDDGAAPELLFDRPGLVDITVFVSDIVEGAHIPNYSAADLFIESHERLRSELGDPASFEPGAEFRIRWNLSDVVIFLETYETFLVLRLVNPAAQELIDISAEDGNGIYGGSFKHHGVIDTDDWSQLSGELVESISRITLNGVLTVRGAGGRFVRFMLRRDGVGAPSDPPTRPRIFCEISGNGEMEPRYHMSTPDHLALTRSGWMRPARKGRKTWCRELDWPAHRSDIRVLVDSAITALRDYLKVERPAKLYLETTDMTYPG